jgi:hypothetical protein
MIRILSLCVAILGATPALALSCFPPTIQQAFMGVQDSPEMFAPVVGRFDGFASRAPSNSQNPQDRTFWANFDGSHISSKGAKSDRTLQVQVQITETCAASWCGNLAAGTQMLTYLLKSGNSYFLTVGPCGGNSVINPTAMQVKTVRSCMAKGRC